MGPHEHGDADEVARLAGTVTTLELGRYPEPLAPATAARRARLAPVRPREVAEAAAKLATEHDLVLIEGAGGLLVRFDDEGGTLADVATLLDAPVLLVVAAGLGTLNTTELTAREIRRRGLDLAGLVIGSWPDSADLASRCNLADLPVVAEAPLLGALPAGAAPGRPPSSGPGHRVGWHRHWAAPGTRTPSPGPVERSPKGVTDLHGGQSR